MSEHRNQDFGPCRTLRGLDRAKVVQFNWEVVRVVRKVLVRREHPQFVPRCDGANQEISRGPLNPTGPTPVVKLGCALIIIFIQRKVGEKPEIFP
jgi:hypothetical protein